MKQNPLFYNYYATESQKELIQTYYTAGIGHGEAKKAAAALLLVKKLLRFKQLNDLGILICHFEILN